MTPPADLQSIDYISEHVYHRPAPAGEIAKWELMPELPSAEEILAPQISVTQLPENPMGKLWATKKAYLRAQYTLLRCEGVEGLRVAVSRYRSSTKSRDDRVMCVYKRVHVLGYLLARRGMICRISFSTENAAGRINWQLSRRLIPGTIVALSADGFQKDCKVATVAQRLYKDGLDRYPPEIDIMWAEPDDCVVDPDLPLVMVESRLGYFEAVRHTLVGLQISAKYESPLDKYLIRGDTSDPSAQFVKENPIMDLSPISPVPGSGDIAWERDNLRSCNVLEGIPDLGQTTTLDGSQIAAVHRIISKELAMVQGPPGTGKTFTSVAALQVLLANRRPGDPPLIVAAQTNHALDQLLLFLLDHRIPILRLGGRTENDIIAKRTMYAVRQRLSGAKSRFAALRADLRASAKAVSELVEAIFSDGLLDPDALLRFGILTEAQHESLALDDDMEQIESHGAAGPFSMWLGDGRIRADTVRQSRYYDAEEDKASFDNDEESEDVLEDLDRTVANEGKYDPIRGDWVPLSHTWAGKEPSHLIDWHRKAKLELRKQDLYEIPKVMRGAVYQLLMATYLAKLQPELASAVKNYNAVCREVKVDGWRSDVIAIREGCISVIGCTTTGLSKYRGLLSTLQPRTMLIEEAAETREANVSSALFRTVQQLILVGDHQQLAPHCNIRWLGEEPFNLSVSLFERMIGLGIPYDMLCKQRRMIPPIRKILAPFYPNLTDHPLVTNLENWPPVPGMGGRNVWLFTHDWEESTDANRSKDNEQEARMIAGFFAYLVANGVSPSKITVLTYYRGQRELITGKLRKSGSVADGPPNVYTVDSYQGEENDVVLVSMVRSPRTSEPKAAGFLVEANRAIVALSRARRGLYLFGNIDNAMGASEDSFQLWARIWNGFASNGWVRRKNGLPLTCQNHNRITWIKEPDDLSDNAGGCGESCGVMRPCGHECTLKCHVIPHENLGCSKACDKVLECGHGCVNICSQLCHCDCVEYKLIKGRKNILTKWPEDYAGLEELILQEIATTAAAEMRQEKQDQQQQQQDQQVIQDRYRPTRLVDGVRALVGESVVSRRVEEISVGNDGGTVGDGAGEERLVEL